jgi:hypothetical protein
MMGLEPTTSGTTIRRSNLLSYTHHLGRQIYCSVDIGCNILNR